MINDVVLESRDRMRLLHSTLMDIKDLYELVLNNSGIPSMFEVSFRNMSHVRVDSGLVIKELAGWGDKDQIIFSRVGFGKAHPYRSDKLNCINSLSAIDVLKKNKDCVVKAMRKHLTPAKQVYADVAEEFFDVFDYSLFQRKEEDCRHRFVVPDGGVKLLDYTGGVFRQAYTPTVDVLFNPLEVVITEVSFTKNGYIQLFGGPVTHLVTGVPHLSQWSVIEPLVGWLQEKADEQKCMLQKALDDKNVVVLKMKEALAPLYVTKKL